MPYKIKVHHINAGQSNSTLILLKENLQIKKANAIFDYINSYRTTLFCKGIL